jgi:hypothetical protein
MACAPVCTRKADDAEGTNAYHHPRRSGRWRSDVWERRRGAARSQTRRGVRGVQDARPGRRQDVRRGNRRHRRTVGMTDTTDPTLFVAAGAVGDLRHRCLICSSHPPRAGATCPPRKSPFWRTGCSNGSSPMMDGSMDRPKKQVEQVADDTDPDGLPRADAAFFAALETDALTARCFAFVCRTVRLCPCVVAMFRSQRLAVLNHVVAVAARKLSGSPTWRS